MLGLRHLRRDATDVWMSVAEIWRVIDTGLRPAAQNIALNRALLEARQAEEIPSTLRFLRFAPCALLSYQQSAEQEFNLDYCKASNVAIQRRITGGGAIYFDETQIGWELYLHKRDVGTTDMQAISRRICHAAATAISALGVDARYQVALREVDTPDWVNLIARPVNAMPILEAEQKFASGTLRVSVTFDTTMQTIKQVWFTGDIFVNPRRTVADLEAALRDLSIDRLAQKIEGFFASRPADMRSLKPADFITVVRLAVKQPLLAQNP